MSKRYDQLIRMRKWELDGLRRELSEMESVRLDLAAQIDRLGEELKYEGGIVGEGDVVHVDFGGYAAANLARRRRIDRSLAELDEKIEEKRAAVTDAFKALKTIEIAAERAAERARKKRQKEEQTFLDDLAARTEPGLAGGAGE